MAYGNSSSSKSESASHQFVPPSNSKGSNAAATCPLGINAVPPSTAQVPHSDMCTRQLSASVSYIACRNQKLLRRLFALMPDESLGLGARDIRPSYQPHRNSVKIQLSGPVDMGSSSGGPADLYIGLVPVRRNGSKRHRRK